MADAAKWQALHQEAERSHLRQPAESRGGGSCSGMGLRPSVPSQNHALLPARLQLPEQCLELGPKGSNLSLRVTFLNGPTTEYTHRKATVLRMDLQGKPSFTPYPSA